MSEIEPVSLLLGFVLGVIASVVGNAVWDKWKRRRRKPYLRAETDISTKQISFEGNVPLGKYTVEINEKGIVFKYI